MKEEKLKKLLEKYYNGQTTDEDETLLKDFFRNQKAQGFEADKELFSALSDLEIIPEPSSDFDKRIYSAIRSLDSKKRIKTFSRHYISIIGIAAAFLLLIGSYFLFIYKAGPKDTFSDPQIAYAETIKILREVSDKFNKGKAELLPLTRMDNATRLGLEELDRSADVISASLDKIEPFIEMSEIDDDN
jgi:hypothetical protein